MKKLRYQHGVARSQEQPRPLETSIFAEQQQQAKTGTITSPSGTDATIRALGEAAPVTDTLAGVMRDAFSAATLDKKAIINFGTRKVTIVPAATDTSSIMTAGEVSEASVITPDDETKATTSFTGTDGDVTGSPEILALLAEVKPKYSVESLVNNLEDVATELALLDPPMTLIVQVDQSNKTITVVSTTVEAAEGFNGATLLAEDAEFVQTLVSSTGRQFGE